MLRFWDFLKINWCLSRLEFKGSCIVSRKTPTYFTRISLNQRCFWFSSLGSLFYHLFRYSTVTKQAHRPASISSRAVQHSIFNIQYSSLLIYHSILIIIRLFILFNIHVCSEWHTRFFLYSRRLRDSPTITQPISPPNISLKLII